MWRLMKYALFKRKSLPFGRGLPFFTAFICNSTGSPKKRIVTFRLTLKQPKARLRVSAFEGEAEKLT